MKKIYKNIKDVFLEKYYSLKPVKIEYMIAILICFIMLITYVYVDLKSLTIWSTNMLDVIYDGHPENYFLYTSYNIFNAPHQYVSGTIWNFIPWAIWNIPIWIFQRFFNVPILTTPLSLIWSKLFLVACLCLTLYYAYKIVINLTSDKNKASWIVFLSLTFFYTFIGVFYSGQTDIMICLLGTMAIYHLINNNEKKFLILSSFAISIKYFFFFPFLAVLLLIEKDIFKIVKKIFVSLLPIIICALICRFAPMYDVSNAANPLKDMLSGLIMGYLPVVNHTTLSIFILGLCLVYIMAYLTKVKDNDLKNNYILYFTTVPLMLLFMFTHYQHYRMILLMPFLLILLSLKPKLWHFNILLETIMILPSVFIMVGSDIGYFFSTSNSMKHGLLAQIFGGITSDSYIGIYAGSEMYKILSSVAVSIFIGIMLVIMIINYPTFKEEKLSYIKYKNDRFLIWLRMAVILPFLFYTIYMGLR